MTQVKEFLQSFFHGTKVEFKVGDLITAGNDSNYGDRKTAKYVYLTSNLNVAVWGAELAVGTTHERIYVVEPTGEIENDPNVTDKRFPGNPTRSFRSLNPLKVVGEVKGWQGHSAEEIAIRLDSLKEIAKNGGQIIE